MRTLAERLQARGLSLAAISSGSTGSALLTNPRGPAGAGLLVSGYFEPGARVAWPDAASAAILERFGPAPAKQGAGGYEAAVTWTQRVLREYVLPELRPAVVINWLTEPDHTQHVRGVGSPEARAALRHADAEIAAVLADLDRRGVAGSDRGGRRLRPRIHPNTGGVDVVAELVEAKLKASAESTDVVLASSGQAVALHVADGDAERIDRIARSRGRGRGAACCSPRLASRATGAAPSRARSRWTRSTSTTPSGAPTSW